MPSFPVDLAHRPSIFLACVPASPEMLDRACDLQERAVVAVATGDGDQPSSAAVARAFGSALGLDPELLNVSPHVPGCLIVELPSSAHRVEALRWPCGICIGNRRHQLRAWTPASVEATSASLCFKVRVCFEGVPPHARQLSTVGSLLPPETLLERVDNNPLVERERGCFSVIAWTHDPASIATFGLVRLEHIAGRPETHWRLDGLGRPRDRRERRGPVPLLSFPVLLHLDYAVDYRPPSARRPIADGEWPPAYQLQWQRGVRDGDDGPTPFSLLPRDRFIFRRDRSPPSAGGSASVQDTATSALRPVGRNVPLSGGGSASGPGGTGNGGHAHGQGASVSSGDGSGSHGRTDPVGAGLAPQGSKPQNSKEGGSSALRLLMPWLCRQV
jgi:hypothetical protein